MEEALEAFMYYYKNLRFHEQTPENIKYFILELKKKAEELKIQLSDREKVLIEFPRGNNYKNAHITKNDFEWDVLEEYFKKPITETLTRIKNLASHEEVQIDQIVLVGGSAKIPYILELIKKIFPQIPTNLMEESEKAVVKGAAIIGAISSGIPVAPFGLNRVKNIVSHDLYIEQKGDKAIKIAKKGMEIPFDPIHKKFRINHALRTKLDIIIKERYEQNSLEDDEDIVYENIIKEISFYHPFFYTGEEIDVILETDELGLWTMKIIHVATGESVEYESERRNVLTGRSFEDAKNRISNIKIDS